MFKRNGNMLFWSIGRLGGAIYLRSAKSPEQRLANKELQRSQRLRQRELARIGKMAMRRSFNAY